MRQLKKRKRYASTLTLLIGLTLLLISCQSSPEVVTETETVVPPLTFPTPPDPAGFVTVKGEQVIVEIEWWTQLAEYMIDVDAVRKQYNLYREAYE